MENTMPVWLVLAIAVVGLIGGLLTIWVWVRPGVKRGAAVADAILGEEAVRDRSGKEIQPARPGLVSRVGTVEDTLALLVETNATLTDHERRIKQLETAAVERMLIKAETAALLSAVSDEKKEGE